MNARVSAQTRKSVADLLKRKARSMVIFLAILIPVGGLTAVSVADNSLWASYAFSIGHSGTRQDVTFEVVHVGRSLIAELSRQPNVREVQLATVLDTQWHVAAAPGHVDFRITGYDDPRLVPLTPFQLLAGRYPGPGQIVMEYGDRALQPYRIGDRVTIDTANGSATLRVVGVARTPGTNPATSGQAVGYMRTAALDRLPASGPTSGAVQSLRFEEISLRLQNPSAYRATVGSVESLFRAHKAEVLGVVPPGEDAPVTQLDGILALVRVLLAVALVLASVLVMNAAAALVATDAPVIGTMKALGATRAKVVRGYSTTVLFHGLVATPIGIGLGIVLGAKVASAMAASIPLAPGPLVVSPAAVGLAGAVGLAVPLAAAFVPLWLGTRVSVREALDGWGVAGIEGNRPRPLPRLLGAPFGRVPQTVWLGLRGLFRKPWKAAMSILTVAVAAVCFLVVGSLASSVNGSIGSVWGSFRADVEVYVGGHSSFREVSSLLARVPNIRRIERVGWFGSQTVWGKVGVWGIEPDSTIYRAKVTSGRWFARRATRVCLISDYLAVRAGLHLGSTVTVPGPAGGRTMRFSVIGMVHEPVDDLSQVGTIDVPIDDLYQLEGVDAAKVGDFTNRVLVQAVERSPAAVDRLTRAIDAAARSTGRGGRQGPIAEIFTFHEEVVRHQRSFLPVYGLLLAVVFLVGVVGTLGLADALTASVVERRRDIGLLRSLGATGRRIATMFWIEGAALSLTAWGIASAVGIPFAYLFVQLFRQRVMPIDFHFDPLSIVAMIAITLAVASASAILPAWSAARLQTAELLRTD